MVPPNAGLHVRFRRTQGGIDGLSMCCPYALVSTNQRRQRHALRSRNREIPGGTVVGGVPPFTASARRRLDANQLVARDGMLPLGQPGELYLIDRTLETPRGRQAAMPCAQNLLSLAVIVLADVP